jgi:hypothetical protein
VLPDDDDDDDDDVDDDDMRSAIETCRSSESVLM